MDLTHSRHLPTATIARRDGGSRLSSRLLAAGLCVVVALPFAFAAQGALESSYAFYGDRVEWQMRLMIYWPLVMLALSTGAKRFHVAAAIYWAWSFVFLGLAPAFQLSRHGFPWQGAFQVSVIEDAQALVLLGHGAFALMNWATRARKSKGSTDEVPEGGDGSRLVDAAPRTVATKYLSRVLGYLGLAFVASSAVFVALSGSALFNARAAFRSRVLEIAALPLGGFLYFAVTAGAIVIPGALLASRRHGVRVPTWLVVVTLIAGAVVTNPLVGSRFLTGSFLVATAIAFLYRSSLLRLVPIGSVVLLILVFPSLDVLRGDASGSHEIEVLSIERSMLDYDFDAFEMGAREVSVSSAAREQLPSSTHMMIAPIARWIPIVSRPYTGDAGGQVVATATGMRYTNVSMPLWAEGHLIGGVVGTIVALGALGAWVGLTGQGTRSALRVPQIAALPGSTALLFIVLRGSIYEVLGYLALAVLIYFWLSHAERERDHA